MGAIEPQVKTPSISDVARDALKAENYDAEKATQRMVRRVRKDPDLYRALLDGLLENACYGEISKQLRDRRSVVWNAPNYDAGGKGERVKALAAGNSLMFFELPNHVLLGRAKKSDVEEAATFYSKQAEDMGHKARWLALIARHLKADKTVAACLTAKQLEKFQKETENG